MYYFCTYFDINYLSRALCLFDSLERHCPSFRIYTLCLDAICLEKLEQMNRSYVVPVGLEELEINASQLAEVKSTRSRLEYYYTCGPVFLDYVIKKYPEIDILTLLDADLYFFSDPEPLFKIFDGYSIGVTPHFRVKHRKPPWQGKYNVGWIMFRRDSNGLACLEWWRNRCIEWCYERYEDGKYADQLYLEQWPHLFEGFYEITHLGANLAPWNVRDHRLSLCDGKIYVDEDPLIFYHFHNVKKIAKYVYYTNLGLCLNPSPLLRRYIIRDYVRCLERYKLTTNPTSSIRQYRSRYHLFKSLARLFLAILGRHFVFVYKEHVF